MKVDDLLEELRAIRGVAASEEVAHVVEQLLLRLEEHSELRGLWDRVYAATVQGCAMRNSGLDYAMDMAVAWANEAVTRAAVRWSGADPEVRP